MDTINAKSPQSLFVIREIHNKPRHIPAFSTHNSYEIYILYEGARNVFIGTTLYSTVSGDVFFVNPNIPHRSYGTGFNGIGIEISVDYLKTKLSHKDFEMLQDCFKHKVVTISQTAVNDIWNMDIPHSENEKEEYLKSVTSCILKNIFTYSANDKLLFTNDLSPVGNYIQKHYLEKCSLDEIAAHFGISKVHLCRSFKQRTGLTVVIY